MFSSQAILLQNSQSNILSFSQNNDSLDYSLDLNKSISFNHSRTQLHRKIENISKIYKSIEKRLTCAKYKKDSQKEFQNEATSSLKIKNIMSAIHQRNSALLKLISKNGKEKKVVFNDYNYQKEINDENDLSMGQFQKLINQKQAVSKQKLQSYQNLLLSQKCRSQTNQEKMKQLKSMKIYQLGNSQVCQSKYLLNDCFSSEKLPHSTVNNANINSNRKIQQMLGQSQNSKQGNTPLAYQSNLLIDDSQKSLKHINSLTLLPPHPSKCTSTLETRRQIENQKSQDLSVKLLQDSRDQKALKIQNRNSFSFGSIESYCQQIRSKNSLICNRMKKISQNLGSIKSDLKKLSIIQQKSHPTQRQNLKHYPDNQILKGLQTLAEQYSFTEQFTKSNCQKIDDNKIDRNSSFGFAKELICQQVQASQESIMKHNQVFQNEHRNQDKIFQHIQLSSFNDYSDKQAEEIQRLLRQNQELLDYAYGLEQKHKFKKKQTLAQCTVKQTKLRQQIGNKHYTRFYSQDRQKQKANQNLITKGYSISNMDQNVGFISSSNTINSNELLQIRSIFQNNTKNLQKISNKRLDQQVNRYSSNRNSSETDYQVRNSILNRNNVTAFNQSQQVSFGDTYQNEPHEQCEEDYEQEVQSQRSYKNIHVCQTLRNNSNRNFRKDKYQNRKGQNQDRKNTYQDKFYRRTDSKQHDLTFKDRNNQFQQRLSQSGQKVNRVYQCPSKPQSTTKTNMQTNFHRRTRQFEPAIKTNTKQPIQIANYDSNQIIKETQQSKKQIFMKKYQNPNSLLMPAKIVYISKQNIQNKLQQLQTRTLDKDHNQRPGNFDNYYSSGEACRPTILKKVNCLTPQKKFNKSFENISMQSNFSPILKVKQDFSKNRKNCQLHSSEKLDESVNNNQLNLPIFQSRSYQIQQIPLSQMQNNLIASNNANKKGFNLTNNKFYTSIHTKLQSFADTYVKPPCKQSLFQPNHFGMSQFETIDNLNSQGSTYRIQTIFKSPKTRRNNFAPQNQILGSKKVRIESISPNKKHLQRRGIAVSLKKY